MFLVAGMFMRLKEVRKQMNQEFKRLGYDIQEKRFIVYQVLGYTPFMKELTVEEMQRITTYLRDIEAHKENTKEVGV